MNQELPSLPLAEWADTRITLHLFLQIVGKIRMRLSPPVNHWWHIPFYVSSRGLTTGPIPEPRGTFTMEFDLLDHDLVLRTSHGETRKIPLAGTAVAGFYAQVTGHLEELGIPVRILARPFDSSRTQSNIPFAEDRTHASYDPEYVTRYHRILTATDTVFHEFRGRFIGKCSPVHVFWHSMDIAVTRFSGRAVTVPEDADPVTREAYSHEVLSAGFWVGDENLPEPAYYAYAAPEPDGLAGEPLGPTGAWWQEQGESHMALYRYEDLRKTADPRAALLEFLQSSYEAGARRAGWPRRDLERNP